MMLTVPNAARGIFTPLPVVQPPAAWLQPKFNQTQSNTNTNTSNFCCICTPSGRKCPDNYQSSDHPEWSDPESEENWDREIQEREREREREKEQNEVKNKQEQ